MVSRGHTLERLRDSSEYVGIAERENTKEGCWNERTRRSVLERENSKECTRTRVLVQSQLGSVLQVGVGATGRC